MKTGGVVDVPWRYHTDVEESCGQSCCLSMYQELAFFFSHCRLVGWLDCMFLVYLA